MSRATVILFQIFIALAGFLWAAPFVRAAHFYAQSKMATGFPATTVFASNPENITIPSVVRFHKTRDLGLLVKVWLNDVGPYTFALDTGAGISVVSEKLVQRGSLAIRAGRHVWLGGLSSSNALADHEAIIDRLSLGSADNFMPAKVVAAIVSRLPSGIDGVLDPTEAYAPLGYSIDMPNGRIEALDPGVNALSLKRPPPGGTVIHWVHDSDTRRPFVRLGDGRLALLDTGSGLGLAITESGSRSGNLKRSAGVRDLGGGVVESRRASPTTVSIGALVLRGVPTDILTGAEKGAPVILGREALDPFRITFDPINRLIEIAPPSRT